MPELSSGCFNCIMQGRSSSCDDDDTHNMMEIVRREIDYFPDPSPILEAAQLSVKIKFP